MPHYISKEGLEKLKRELEELKTVKRPEVINRIKVAREQGDLTENAEYSDAKDEQSFIEGRIIEIENLINKSVLISANGGGSNGEVTVGVTVVVDCGGRQMRYTIVGSNEANPTGGLISNESPMGRAFLGKKVGEVAVVNVPKGEMACRIVEIVHG
ncbi:MAG: transcription elongation factor GreA [Patescibacteria group bacterium]|nr:transcription elongation factor GreA [Patescibacteria group bacterium]